MTTTHQIENQIEVERLAREAGKVYSITALLNKADDADQYTGAFEAAEDIAIDLWSDLKKLADKINREKWNDVSETGNDNIRACEDGVSPVRAE